MSVHYVYHVVTDRPVEPGQIILFDDIHHNGVYDRVMTFLKILSGESAEGAVAELIRADMKRWSEVAYRELALEQIRNEQFPDYPSRMACLYSSRTLEEAKSWAQFFKEIGRSVLSIVKLRAAGRIFDGDACNCFQGTSDEKDNLEKAIRYWRNDVVNEKPVIETLIDGEITVEEIIVDFRYDIRG